MIRANAICKSFAGKQVLSGIDLDIKPGMIFGLLGPSGAGKTTLIKIITGQLGFDSGDVTVFEKNVSDLTGTDKKQIGIMMDDHGVYDRLSCTDNLKIFADIYGIPHSKIISALEEVGLKDAAKKPAMKLSKGMRARLQLARVFMVSPKILFLDEPTTGVDVVSRIEFWDMLQSLRQQGITILVSTPYMDEAQRCGRVALINDGCLLDIDTPEQIVQRAGQTTFEEAFIHLMSLQQ
jgi:ABC-2 type transport system ATP-binding protein